MFYNLIKKEDLIHPISNDLKDCDWDLFEHPQDKDIYMLCRDYNYIKNCEICEDIKFRRLELFMKRFINKHKQYHSFMVTFRLCDEGEPEVLDVMLIPGMLLYYLPHDDIVEMFSKTKIKVKNITRCKLSDWMQKNESNGNFVGSPTAGYLDDKHIKIRIRI